MKIVKQGWCFEEPVNGVAILKKIEQAGRTCYKTEDKITDTSAVEFCQRILKSDHHSVIEHHNVSVRIVTDRGVTHEIVRHRLASYSQESTRYCNYSQSRFGEEITVILPVWFPVIWVGTNFDVGPLSDRARQYLMWLKSMREAETAYFDLVSLGQTPQEARSVLPNSLKTEIVMTANLREWRHFFKLRCSKAAHPQMRELAQSMHRGFMDEIPVMFDDIEY